MKVEGRHHWILKSLVDEVLGEDEHSNVTTDTGLDTIVGLISKVSGSEPILSIAFGVGAIKGASAYGSTRLTTKDLDRTESDNYWRHAALTYTAGQNKGVRKLISSSSIGVLNHLAFPYDPANGDTYVLTPHLGATQLGDEPSGSGWRKAVEVEIVQNADHVSNESAIVRLSAKFSGSEAEGTLNECGLFTSLVSNEGNMIVSDGFADLTKDPDTVLVWVWELTLSR